MKKLSPIALSSNSKAIFFGVFLLLTILAALHLTDNFRVNVLGELYYDIHYADRYSWWESWQNYAYDRVGARVMHGISISMLYEIFGFNPPVLFTILALFQIATAAFLTTSIEDLLPEPWMAWLATLIFAFLPLGLINVMMFQVFAPFFAFATVVLFKQYIKTSSRFLLWATVFIQIVTALSSEGVLLVLPVAVLLSLKYIHTWSELIKKLVLSGVIVSGSFVINLIAESLTTSQGGRFIGLFQGSYGGFGGLEFVGGFFQDTWNFEPLGVWYEPGVLVGWFYRLLVCLCILGAVVALWKSSKDFKDWLQYPSTGLFLSGVYLTFVFWLPYLLISMSRPEDSLLGFSYALVFIALAALLPWFSTKYKTLASVFLLAVAGFWIYVGAADYAVGMRYYKPREIALARFSVTLKEQVPQVKEHTTFIFINSTFSRTGCIGIMNMLYDRNRIRCIHLFDNDTEEMYVWEDGALWEDDGRMYESDFIIVSFSEDGTTHLYERIAEGDFPEVPLTFVDEGPVPMNQTRITNVPGRQETPFYFYQVELLKRTEPKP